MTCALGLICEFQSCPNRDSCYAWAYPWPLPYSYDPKDRCLLVKLNRIDLFDDFKFDLNQEWRSHGFENAVELPCFYNPEASTLTVLRSIYPNFRRAWELPYVVDILPDGTRCLTVQYDLCNTPYSWHASKAGWLVAEWLVDELLF